MAQVDLSNGNIHIDQLMAVGGLFLDIEWPIFWQKGPADVAAVIICVFTTMITKSH